MSELESLDAARRLLGTIQAGQVALTQLAAAHLPFSRLKSICELQVDPYAASLPQVGALVDGRLRLLRLSLYGAMAGGVAAPEATPSVGGDPSVMVWMEQVAREAGERSAREVGDRLLRESNERAQRRERELTAKLEAERQEREYAQLAAEEASTKATEALDRCAQLQAQARASEERLRADLDRFWKEAAAQSADASVQFAALEARLADGATTQEEAQRRLEAAEERLRYAEQAAEDARNAATRQAAEAQQRLQQAVAEAEREAELRSAERQRVAVAEAEREAEQRAAERQRRELEAAAEADRQAEEAAAAAAAAAAALVRQNVAVAPPDPSSVAGEETAPGPSGPANVLEIRALPPIDDLTEDLPPVDHTADSGLSMTAELADALGGTAAPSPELLRAPTLPDQDTPSFLDLEPADDVSPLGPAPLVGFAAGDEPTHVSMPSMSLLNALAVTDDLVLPRDPDQDAPTNPPVENTRDSDDFGGELLKAPRVAGAALVTISQEDMEEEPQVVTSTNRQVTFRVGERDVLPEAEASPARVAVPREGGGVAITARTTRISQPRSPSAAPSEEVIISGEGGDQDRSDDGTLKVSLEPVSHSDIKVPELTDDDEEEAPELVPQPVVGPAPVDAVKIKALLAEAKAAHERGDLHKAIQLLSDALEMDPERADAYINRGHSHLDLGDYSSAMSDFQRAEDLEPKKAEPHFAMGNLYFNRKEYKRAIEFYDHALELDGSHAMARCRRGISHYYRKSYRQAVQDLQAAFRLDPEIPNIKKYVQMAMKKLDRPD